ncbi:hypothetical protein [Mesorhizobium sp.]|uniref:hypothetical protein n=1 Tax=Mesorhizobium sp. TaxID=1871066 RepID=UPI000FE79E6A|nr:hypothetical protein [Mesorhizobium sp.]RWE37448.1 MAG: hypothetical protein EOS77_02390 [Mesorhizobium sp.]
MSVVIRSADDLAGAIAYALTKRLVIDMSTARAAVDEALKQSSQPQTLKLCETRADVYCNCEGFYPACREAPATESIADKAASYRRAASDSGRPVPKHGSGP